MSPPDLAELAGHLGLETDALFEVLEAATPSDWQTQTPAEGWTVADTVGHLAYFDEAATASVLDAERFEPYLAEAIAHGAQLCDVVAERYRSLGPGALLSWWRTARGAMLDAMLASDPSRRVPWYGPELSVASALSARIMETWAHAQDVYDALGRAHPATAALYDVARLCSRTRANSYAARGRAVPMGDVAVELTSPDGSTWRFGAEGVVEAVRGDAVEFCLVCTQRRHVADTSLTATGPLAVEWLGIAQAYAGPAGAGRQPRGAAA